MNSIEIFSKWIEKRNLPKNQLIMPLDRIIILFGYKGVPLIFLTLTQQICIYTCYWMISFGFIYSLIIYFLIDFEALQQLAVGRSLAVLFVSGFIFALAVASSMRKRKNKYQIPDWDQIKLVE